MLHATRLWTLWLALLTPFARAFTPRGFPRFVEWTTGLVLNSEEHTITQSLFALDRTQDWKAVEIFAEIGHWNVELVELTIAQQLERAPGRLWYGYRVSALDDSKVHRSSKDVWGTCTFHDYSARCPNRASTVRAHNWVVLGALLHNPGQPAWFLPQTGKLYFRKSQLPTSPDPEEFHTKCELAVGLFHQQATQVPGKQLGVFDGAFAVRSVVRSLVLPPEGEPRTEFLTRLRRDARLCELPSATKPAGRPGPQPKWGPRLLPPKQAGHWRVLWQEGDVFLYGRMRHVRWKERVCLWRVLGHEVPVKVAVAEVEGYKKRFNLVGSVLEWTGLQMLEVFGARFRQEDGFRDLKQRLGWEECRAWTKKPVLRTSWLQLLTLSLLRLLQFQLDMVGELWWQAPPWNQKKTRPSVLDVARWFGRYRPEIQQLVSEWLASQEVAETPEGVGEPGP